jgi:tripartite-type tricarboxylate transporter receptor subunit TctC
MTEGGYPQVGFHPDVWMGIFGPAGMPPAIVEKLNHAINEVMQSEEIKPSLKRFGYGTKIMTPAQFATFFAGEIKKWPPVLKSAGIKPQ